MLSVAVAAWAAVGGAAVGAEREHPLAQTLRENLQQIADAESKAYQCVVNIGLTGPGGLAISVAAGEGVVVGDDGTQSVPATPESVFAWGSVTKMVTGVTIIRMANAGELSLDDRVAPIVDPYFAAQGKNLTLTGMYGPHAADITIRQLATMTAGVNDFDTAKPNETDFSKSKDPFRATVYKNPDKDWTPYDLLTLPWVANGKMEFAPGTDKDYSSSNFILLGLVIAAKRGVAWDSLDQKAFLPSANADLLQHTKFAAHGAPSAYSNLNAYDRTSYNGHNSSSLPGTPVSNVHGVFGGWTASDIAGPVQDIADLAYAIYGPQGPKSLVTRENIAMMVNKSQGFYGFATFLLNDFTGRPTDGHPDMGTCYGHLGATYGWNSIVLFTPGNNMSISVATNTETNEQATPSDAYCVAYNRVRQILAIADGTQKTPIQDCVYDASGYFGQCVCPDVRYVCVKGHHGGGCIPSLNGTLDHDACFKQCGWET